MKILGLINRDSACGFHRIMMPLLLMNDIDTYITNAPQPKDFEGIDAVYYNRHINEDLIELAQKNNAKIVVDVDDYWKLDTHHISARQYRDLNYEALQVKHIQRADVVTTTHERLADVIYLVNKNVVIVPNAIPSHDYFPVQKTESEFTRVFWQGSITHEKDIKILEPVVKKLGDKFFMVMAGMTDHPAWVRMANYFTNNQKQKGVVIPAKPIFNYYENYQFADVCVCPLVPSKFNGYKSNLKVLEAAHSGLPVIASNVHPYLNLPILYARKREDWAMWLNDKDALKESAVKLQKHAWLNYDFHSINQKRKEAFAK